MLAANEVVVPRVAGTVVSAGTDDGTTTVLEPAVVTPNAAEDSVLGSTGVGEVTVVNGGVYPRSSPQPARSRTTNPVKHTTGKRKHRFR